MITGEQIKVARELLGWTRAQLSQRARTMTVNGIRKAEEGYEAALSREQIDDARRVLEAAGIVFTNGGEPSPAGKMEEPLPPPPDTVVVGEFTFHLRQGLNRAWLAQIVDRDGPRMMVRGRGRECTIRRARAWCARAMKRPDERPRKRRPRQKAPS